MEVWLPEEILEHIFSFLSFDKTLIQTSLLSKRWRNFWVSTPAATNLCFDVNFPHGHGCSMDFFLRFLKHRCDDNTVLRRLRAQWSPSCNTELFNELISTALEYKVQDLHVSFGTSVAERSLCLNALPLSLYSAPNLKTLTLENALAFRLVENGEQQIAPIICPDLETLVLRNCYREHRFMPTGGPRGRSILVGGKKLRKLVVEYDVANEYNFSLFTPILSTFLYRDRLGNGFLECLFGNLDTLNDVGVDSWFDASCISNGLKCSKLGELPVKEASHARVSVHGNFSALERITDNLKRRLLKYCDNLRSLELNTSLNSTAGAIRFASSLVSSFSSIEILLLQVVGHNQALDATNSKMVPELPLTCSLNQLKYIAVQGVEGFACELEFYTFLLKRAVNLQRMVIIEFAEKFLGHKRRVLEQFCDKLSKQFPRVRFSFQLL